MPALNFPSSPASGDVYSFGNRAWRYDGRAWQAYPSVVQGIADLTVGGDVNAEGDVNVSEGDVNISGDLGFPIAGTFTTTIQASPPSADRVITFPNASGLVAILTGISPGQLTYNLNGALAGISTMTFDGTSVTLAGRLINSYTSVASAPAKLLSGTWFTGGTGTTTKPHFLIEPSNATSTGWSALGTGLGINASSGFTGRLLDLQLNGVSAFNVDSTGRVGVGLTTPSALLDINSDTIRLRTSRTPASATATGNAGDICWDTNFVYVCTAANTWRRIAHATW